MTPETFRFVAAATHFVPALLWGTIAHHVGHYFRHRRPREVFPRIVFALACVTTLHYSTWTLAALLRGHLQDRSPLRGALMATMDASVIMIIALGRHVGVLWGRHRQKPSTAWIVGNYALCAVVVVCVVFAELFVLQLPGWQACAIYSGYLFVLGVALVFDFRRGATRGAWRPGGLWQVRTADVVVLAVALVLIGLEQVIPLTVGATNLGLLLTTQPSAIALSMYVLNGTAALVFAIPFIVRNLGDLLPTFLTTLAATAAVLAVHTTVRAAAIGRTDPEILALVDAAAMGAIVFVVMPLRTWLGGAIGRMLFRRGRLRWAELHAVIHALPPEAGVGECCRRTLAALVRVMKLRGAAILLRDGRTVVEGAIDTAPLDGAWPCDGAGIPDHPLAAIHFRDLPPAASDALTAADVLAVIPLASPRRRWGWLFLTTDLRGASFDDEDDAGLVAVADQTALSLDTADLFARTLAVERSLAHAEKLAAIGELAARFAHEIRNPITAARSLAQQLARDPASPLNAEHAGIILEELERVERQVRELLRFARREELELGPVDVGALASATARDLATRLTAGGIALTVDTGDSVVARADRDKLRQVLVNLLENAMDALQNGRPEKHIAVAVTRDGDHAVVRVADDGVGIPTEAQSRIFDPFVSLKSSGTGLGLAIAKRAIDAHNGTITFTSRPGATTFEVRVPLAREARG